MGAALTQGDLEGKKKITDKTGEYSELDLVPNTGFYIIPEIEAGVNMNQHSVFVDLAYSDPVTTYGLNTAEGDETDTDIYRLGLGYRYNFFWPELFQPFIGINYSFMYLETTKNVYLTTDQGTSRKDGILMGNGFALHGGVLYYVERHITMQLHARFRTMFFSTIGTDENGTRDLDKSLKHFSEELIFKIACHF